MAPTGTLDYAALAKQYGGVPAGAPPPGSPNAPPPNYDDLAKQFGGVRADTSPVTLNQPRTGYSGAPVPPVAPAPPAALPKIGTFRGVNLPTEEQVGEMVPEAAMPALSAANKYAVQPFETAAKKTGELGAQVAAETVFDASKPQATGRLATGPNEPANLATEQEAEKQHPVTAGIVRGVGEAAGATVGDPRNWPFFLSTSARPILQRLISNGFRLGLTGNAVESAKQLHDNWDKLTPEQRSQLGTQAGISALLAGGADAIQNHLETGYEPFGKSPAARAEGTFRSLVYKAGGIVPENATFEQANAAYRAAMANLHPDVNPAGAEDAQLLNDAWAKVKDGFKKTPPSTEPTQGPNALTSKLDDLAAQFGGSRVEEKPVHHASNDIEELRASAEKQAPAVGDAVAKAAGNVPGAELEAVRESKDSDRIADKAERQNIQPSQVGDVLATKVTVPDQNAADQVLANLHKELPVESVNGAVSGEPGKNGVRQTQAIVSTNAPANEPVKKAEVILQTPEMAKAAEESHDDYRKAQGLRAAGKEQEAVALERQIAAKHEAAEQAARARQQEEANALRERGAGEILQPASQEVRSAGSERGRVEPGIEGKEAAAPRAQAAGEKEAVVRQPGQAPIPPQSLRDAAAQLQAKLSTSSAGTTSPLKAPVPPSKRENLKGQNVEIRDPQSGEWKVGTVLADVVSGGNDGVRRLRGRFADGKEFDNVKPEEVRKPQAAKPEVGVDFDGTLFKENSDGSIGAPIPERIASLKQRISNGENVIIESHRARHPGGAEQIQNALASAGLPRLPVSAKKDVAPKLIDNQSTKEPGVKVEKVATDANTPLTPKAPKPPAKRAAKQSEYTQRLQSVYTPGNILQDGYWKRYSKVLSFTPEENGKPWSVTEITTDKEGNPLPGERPRTHHTYPDKRTTVVKAAEAAPQPATKIESAHAPAESSAAKDAAEAPLAANGERVAAAKPAEYFTSQVEKDLPSFVDRYLKANTEDGIVRISADRARSLFPEYAASKEGAFTHTVPTNAAASKIASAAFDKAIADGVVNGKQVVFVTGMPGAGKSTAENAIAGNKGKVALVYEGNLSDPALMQRRIGAVLDAGGKPTVYYVKAPPKIALERMVGRQQEIGRYVPIEYGAKVAANTPKSIEALYEKYGDDVKYRAIDNSKGLKEARVERGIDAFRKLAENRTADEIRDEQLDHAAELHKAGKLADEVYERIVPRRTGGPARARDAGEHQKETSGPLEPSSPPGEPSPSKATDESVPKTLPRGEGILPRGMEAGAGRARAIEAGENRPADVRGNEETPASPIEKKDSLIKGESGSFTPSKLSPAHVKQQYDQLVDRVLNRGLKIGDKYYKVAEIDPEIGHALHIMDNAPADINRHAEANVKRVTEGLSDDQVRLAAMMVDSDIRDYLKANKPEEYKAANDDPKVKAAVRAFEPLQQELANDRIALGWPVRKSLHVEEDPASEKPFVVKDREGNVIESFKSEAKAAKYADENGEIEPHLKRVYPEHTATPFPAQTAPGPSTGFVEDKGLRHPHADKKARVKSAEYFYDHGTKDFSGYVKSYRRTKLALATQHLIDEFTENSTPWVEGTARPPSIKYNGEEYYRPDIARQMRQSERDRSRPIAPGIPGKSAKEIREYAVYDPTRGQRFMLISPNEGWAASVTGIPGIKAADRWLGPKQIVDAMDNYDSTRGMDSAGGLDRPNIRHFLQEQIVGLYGPVVHINNILRHAGQATGLGTFDPRSWPSLARIIASPELRARVLKGVDDATIAMLSREGAWVDWSDIGSVNAYIGDNLNPFNWTRAFGKGVLFDPKFLGGWGGLDPKTRVVIADYLKSHYPEMTDQRVAQLVNEAMGEYNRRNWTERQRSLAKVTLFPGWTYGSGKWFLRHLFKVGVAPAVAVLLTNLVINKLGKNKDEDATDPNYVHFGDRKLSSGLVSDNMGAHLMAPVLGAIQAKLNGEDVAAGATEGMMRGGSSLAGTLSGPVIETMADEIFNRKFAGSATELVKPEDRYMPGTWAPNVEWEKRIAFAALKGTPALSRFIDNQGHWDWAQGLGGAAFGLTNYKYGAEERFRANVAKAATYGQTLNQLAEKNPDAAAEFVKDPTKATYLMFHDDLESMARDLKEIDAQMERVRGADISHSDRQQALEDLQSNRNELLKAADGLNDALEGAKQQARKAQASYWTQAAVAGR